MPFTEVIIPTFKQDSSTKDAMEKIWPTASSVFHRTPALLSGLVGQVIFNNGSNTKNGLNLMCLFEWESHEEFKSFLSSHDFETFIGQVGPLLTEPAIPQLFKTDLTVRHVPALPVTEIIRLRADPHYPRDSAWKLLIASIETHSGHAHPSVCGHSVNVEEELWLGIVAWDSLASRDFICNLPAVQVLTKALVHGEKPDIVITEMESFISPRQ